MDFQEFLKTSWDPFDCYKIKMHVDHIAGGVPGNPDMINAWIDAKNKEKTDEEKQKLKDASITELPDLTEEKAQKNFVTFKRDEEGLYIEGRQIKAMLKEAANIIKDKVGGVDRKGGDTKGITAFKSKVADRVFVAEKKIHLGRTKPDRTEERPIHVMTPQGQRTSIKRIDIVDDATMEFTVRRFVCKEVPEKALYAVFAYAQNIGIGADRSQGMGVFKILSVEKISTAA